LLKQNKIIFKFSQTQQNSLTTSILHHSIHTIYFSCYKSISTVFQIKRLTRLLFTPYCFEVNCKKRQNKDLYRPKSNEHVYTNLDLWNIKSSKSFFRTVYYKSCRTYFIICTDNLNLNLKYIVVERKL
jgi:hypothetical protein